MHTYILYKQYKKEVSNYLALRILFLLQGAVVRAHELGALTRQATQLVVCQTGTHIHGQVLDRGEPNRRVRAHQILGVESHVPKVRAIVL